jgi:hypothetical protein
MVPRDSVLTVPAGAGARILGQDPPFRYPDGPLDLASGIVRIERRHPADPEGPADS